MTSQNPAILTEACRLLYPPFNVLFLRLSEHSQSELTPYEQMSYTGITLEVCALFLVITKYVQKDLDTVPFLHLDLSHPASSPDPANALRTYLQDMNPYIDNLPEGQQLIFGYP